MAHILARVEDAAAANICSAGQIPIWSDHYSLAGNKRLDEYRQLGDSESNRAPQT